MDQNTKDILETLSFIKDRMVTKEDVRNIIREEVPPIGRKLAIEIADRHTQSIERHGLTPDDLLYGLKPTTRLDEP
jgi:hypothetical protein